MLMLKARETMKLAKEKQARESEGAQWLHAMYPHTCNIGK